MEKETKKEKKINNLELYDKVRLVPISAKKTISAGRLKGYTDINPMYRIKTLTEQFGVCGIGWKAPIKNKEIIEGANDEKIAIVDIELFIKVNGEWSEPIDGTGGSSFIAKESKGLYTNDECFKMAYTDALSVACKSLGIGADVYWEKDRTKYDKQNEETPQKKAGVQIDYHKLLIAELNKRKINVPEFAQKNKLNAQTPQSVAKQLLEELTKGE